MLLETTLGNMRVHASADSGSDENIISLSAAIQLGFDLDRVSEQHQDFALANGKIVTSLGCLEARYVFASVMPYIEAYASCVFHVMQTLATDVIMGMTFLEETRTLTEHTERLVEQVIEMPQSLRVNSVGRPRSQLSCRVNEHLVCANVDSGSDLDLINPDYARSCAMQIMPGEEEIMFADGSLAYTSGSTVVPFAVVQVDFNDVRSVTRRSEAIDIEFFVLDSLSADVLVGNDTIRDFDVFNRYADCLVPSIRTIGEPNMNTVIHIRRMQRLISNAIGGVGRGSDIYDEDNEVEIDDARENARHSAELQRTQTRSDSPSRHEAHDREVTRHTAYTEARAQGLGIFWCEFPNCNAPAFTTLHLLG